MKLLVLMCWLQLWVTAGDTANFSFHVTVKKNGAALDSAVLTVTDLGDSSVINLLTDKDGNAFTHLTDQHRYKVICGHEPRQGERLIYFKTSAILQKNSSLSSYNLEIETARPDPAVKIENAYFAWNESSIVDTGNLNLLAQILIDNPEIKTLTITGHTDCDETDDSINHLSLKRAQVVAYYLAAHRVKCRLNVVGVGAKYPPNPCTCKPQGALTCTEYDHSKNRLAEFKIDFQ